MKITGLIIKQAGCLKNYACTQPFQDEMHFLAVALN